MTSRSRIHGLYEFVISLKHPVSLTKRPTMPSVYSPT